MRSPGFVSLLLALVTVAVYAPVARYDFVGYDDPDYITNNPHVLGGLSWGSTIWAFKAGYASNWHPLTWLSHMLDCQLFGPSAGAQHLVSVVFHVANTLLLFLVLRRLTGAHGRSAFVAGLFALHPLHVESVAWIAERKDVLSAFFFFLTLWAYARYAESKPGNSEAKGGTEEQASYTPRTVLRFLSSPHYWLALLLFACGLMSKPMLVTLPFVLMLLDYWPLRRWQSGTGGRSVSLENLAEACGGTRGPRLASLLPLLLEKVPFLALSVGSSVVTFWVQREGGSVSVSLSLGARVANALVAYVSYVGKLFCPAKLSVLYPHPGHWPAWQVLGCGLLLAGGCGMVAWLARGRPYLTVGWFWFLGMLVPVIGLVQVGLQSMADRYTYLPSIGLFIMLVWGIQELSSIRRWRSNALVLGVALALVACVFTTESQVQYWRNSETLFRRAIETTSRNYLAYYNLGFYFNAQGRTAEAIDSYLRALEIKPDYADALSNLGFVLAAQRRYPESIQYFQEALRAEPDHLGAHNNLGNVLADVGRVDEAIAHCEVVLKRKPEDADAHNNLGVALVRKGKIEQAIGHFRQAVRINPRDTSFRSNLGNALASQRQWAEAVSNYQQSLRLNPNDAQAHTNLGNALAEHGLLDEAIGHYAKALQLNTNNPEAHFNLGKALARQGKREQALAQYTEALRLKPDYAEARFQQEAISKPARK